MSKHLTFCSITNLKNNLHQKYNMIEDLKIAVITGANKGLGFEVTRQLAKNGILVILTSRDEQKGKEALDKFKSEGLAGYYHQLDITDQNSINEFVKHMTEGIGKIDILINNAGILPEEGSSSQNKVVSIFDIPFENIHSAFNTNTLGPLRLIRSIIPIMSPDGRIVNVSSTMGQLTHMESAYPAYSISKAALNVVTKIASEELKENTDITVNSVCPGWVKTDMGGPKAPKSIEDGADTIVWLALGANGTNPTGKFFRDREEIEW